MALTGNPLHDLAEARGLARHWRDADGRDHVVSDERLEAVLAALGDPAGDARDLPPLLTADAGGEIALPQPARRAEATGEDGATIALAAHGPRLIAPETPGYYDLALDGRTLRLAVAPMHCPPPVPSGQRRFGLSLQIPALRGVRSNAFGTFAELAGAVAVIAGQGCDAVALNPVHALFPGEGGGFSPYSPSSRLFLNGALGDPALIGLPPLAEEPGGAFIDWEQALPRRLAALRALFETLSPTWLARIAADGAMADEGLRRHALFDALYCHFRSSGARGWHEWPEPYRRPESPQVVQFAAAHAGEIAFHLFIQWLARAGLAAAQQAAREGGMGIGLVGDLAVGVTPGGSDCWAMPWAMLRGLTIGAPPDPLGPLGQNWSITGFSPAGLRASGHAPFIAMLRNAFASCGGLRIDHAFSLQRLWVIPEGGGPADGAYLAYPFADLIRLVTLEAHRAGAFVIAEDLGTAPYGFTGTIAERGMPGMQVLWFQRAADHGFIGAQDYSPNAVAMTGTHDTPTVAGWWTGRDLDWADRLGRLPDEVDLAKAQEIREWDRGLLWSTLAPDTARPSAAEPGPVVDAALAHIARTPAPLVLAPFEDVLGEAEQPNLPGTVSEHPNWRRRCACTTADLFAREDVRRRMALLGEGRTTMGEGPMPANMVEESPAPVNQMR
ncbi:MAG TPA: 4-alpha-glucanotransferase [Novosphingobium sp.]|nr:4-alpha-glucanotransferase [Novosphingobium sp.]